MKNSKTNVFDYLIWRGDLTFEQSEFNEIDGLILSILSYLDFSGMKDGGSCPLSEAVDMVLELPDEVKYTGAVMIMRNAVELGSTVPFTKRFGSITVTNFEEKFDEDKELQFSAVTFLLSDGTAFVSYRGTDNTLVGWKEDFNMSFTNGVPSQLEAARYMQDFLRDTDYKIRTGGHSKGGNLAVWASSNQSQEDQMRILNIYSNDGPGFSEGFLKSVSYQRIRDRIDYFVPEASIVGVLMENDTYTTILSTKPALLQHDPFSWVVVGTHFVYDDQRQKAVKHMEKILDTWLKSMTPQEREDFIDSVYDIISSSNARTLEDIDKNKARALFQMQKTFLKMDNKKQVQLISSISKVIFNSDVLERKSIINHILSRVENHTADMIEHIEQVFDPDEQGEAEKKSV